MRSFKANYLIIFIFAGLVMISIIMLFRVTFDYDFEVFFPKGDPDLEYYHEYRKQFEPDDNFLLIAVSNKPNVFEMPFLRKIDSFTKEALSLPHIIQSHSITNIQRPLAIAGNMVMVPIISISNEEKLRGQGEQLMKDDRIHGRFLERNGQSLAIILKTKGVLNLQESYELFEATNLLIEKHGFKDVHIAGRSHYQVLFVQKQEAEFRTYATASVVLILIMLIFIFRKPLTILVCTISVLIGMVLFMGFIGLRGIPLDSMATLYPLLMIIVGMSDVVHIVSKYIDELKLGNTRRQAIRITIREIGLATFLTSLTTAVGFGSLYSSIIPPIKSFGLTASLGVFIAYLTVILLTTSLITLIKPERVIRHRESGKFWRRTMRRLFIVTGRRGKLIGIISLGVIIVSIIGLSQISVNIHIDNNFPRNSKARQDFKYFESEYGGVRSFEMSITPSEGRLVTDREVLLAIDSLEKYIHSLDLIISIFSPTEMFKSLHMAHNGNSLDYFLLTKDEQEWKKYNKAISRAPTSNLNIVISKDKKLGRLTAKFKDIGSIKTFQLKSKIDHWLEENNNPSIVSFRHTGTAHLIDRNGDHIRKNMFFGLALAFMAVSLIMALLFKNWKMVVISLIPNVIPLLITGAIMGFLGIELDAPTSIIFVVAFGIAVDDTIHFLSKFKLELSKGRTVPSAIRHTFNVTGKAICLTTMVLFFGFFILTTSTYPPTFIIGFLVSITLASALFTDLLLTPIIIYMLMGKK